ncbi:hypothetical protein SMD11_1266 [Streptomyces albireticuli]|uniref:DUF3987 domain-containing protein n=1 Tax=Streptomyces albireticuli TaxID=1940 RepID=A0A1Z2KXZ9_9ACTN|nr:DUF3987 domain-containing protein [Streptomyces albireticuli]ARZ66927.1 hypothetical protein SMD11_1266 [Streptomyces albireticuli]
MSSTFKEMQYGPLGKAVAAAMPHTEADPIGVYAATLSLWSAAVNGQVLQPNGRPTVFWSALVGRSKIGRKGFALATARAIVEPTIGAFLSTRSRKGISSGPALVTTLFEVEQESLTSEDGRDGRVMIAEDEWASILKRANRDATYHDQLINAWDGVAVANTTKGKGGKREEQRIDRPLLGYHAHIQPGRWAPLVKPEVALGGAFNRIPHFIVEKSKNLPSEVKRPLDAVKETPALTRAYRWAREKVREMELSPEAAKMHDAYRLEFDDRCASLPEAVSCFIERGDENLLRIACLLTAAERKTVIPLRAWKAAHTMIEYSMACTEKLINEAQAGTGRQMKTVEQIVRESLQRFGGEATRTLILRSLGTRGNADSLDAAIEKMPDVVMERKGSGAKGGAPSFVIKFVDPAGNDQEQGEREHKEEPEGRPKLAVVPPQSERLAPRERPAAKKAPVKKTVKKKDEAASKAIIARQKEDTPANPLADLL